MIVVLLHFEKNYYLIINTQLYFLVTIKVAAIVKKTNRKKQTSQKSRNKQTNKQTKMSEGNRAQNKEPIFILFLHIFAITSGSPANAED